MTYLLDTHVLLWFISGDLRLSKKAREIILDKNTQKNISMASMWEISIKIRIGKLEFVESIDDCFREIENYGIGATYISRDHIKAYETLKLIHRDPFDGIIIATAIYEKMTLITADENIQKYEIPWVW